MAGGVWETLALATTPKLPILPVIPRGIWAGCAHPGVHSNPSLPFTPLEPSPMTTVRDLSVRRTLTAPLSTRQIPVKLLTSVPTEDPEQLISSAQPGSSSLQTL